MGYYVQVEQGVKLFVEDIGAGRPILFVHGWPVNHNMFEYQTTHLPKYGFRCILIDLRGYGKSDKPWTGYSYDRLADDIRVVIDTLGLDNVRLVGFSVGGAIVVRYMGRHRGHKIAQLLLLAAAAPSLTQRPGYPIGQPRANIDKIIAGTYADRPGVLAQFGEDCFASPVSTPFRQWFQSLGLEAANHATVAVMESLRDEFVGQDFPFIRVPTSIFHGVLDKVCLYPLALAQHAGIQGSVLHRFEKSGHGIFYDELELFNQRFFKALNDGH
ncbi:alpha/beta fold hydrolase [Cohnella faecalis]|uniref:Alpha/beta hydrolase n=1 Tax=Cohnella faecalis TaxID=2315694 RepID=A0A398CQ92_9BACL|nr:alpha/beta hydrolase [Cohnella faecalis]RIE04695.1 alpha/beta hydrolase [Cohnella faecalis]